MVLRDARTGKPLENQPYQMTSADGAITQGKTDATGKTSIARSDDPQLVHTEPLVDPRKLEILPGRYWDESSANALDFVKPADTD